MNLGTVQNTLTRMYFDPLSSWSLSVVVDGIFEHVSYRVAHHFLDITHPILDLFVFGINFFDESNLLFFSRNHSAHPILVIEFKISDSLEYFLKMRSYIPDFLSLG